MQFAPSYGGFGRWFGGGGVVVNGLSDVCKGSGLHDETGQILHMEGIGSAHLLTPSKLIGLQGDHSYHTLICQ